MKPSMLPSLVFNHYPHDEIEMYYFYNNFYFFVGYLGNPEA